MTDTQKLTLSEFARRGGMLIPWDDAVRATCRELVALKMLRPQPYVEGRKRLGEPVVVGVAYQVTAKGRKAVKGSTAA